MASGSVLRSGSGSRKRTARGDVEAAGERGVSARVLRDEHHLVEAVVGVVHLREQQRAVARPGAQRIPVRSEEL